MAWVGSTYVVPDPFENIIKNFKKIKNSTCIFRQGVLIYPSVQEITEYPGVAKFGIALEWGSRGLEFESRHSDQKAEESISSFLLFHFDCRK